MIENLEIQDESDNLTVVPIEHVIVKKNESEKRKNLILCYNTRTLSYFHLKKPKMF